MKKSTHNLVAVSALMLIRRLRADLIGGVLSAALSVVLSTLLASVAQAQMAPAVNSQPSPIQQYAADLGNDGITFVSRYNGEFAANPSGGERQGAEFTGELNLGANVDLGKLAGLDGGTINALFTARSGNDLASKSINNSFSVQEIYGDGQTYQLTILTYEQKLANDAIDFKVGRMAVEENFAVSPLYCDFQSNAICGTPSIFGDDVNNGASYYPLAVWGGIAQLNPTPDLYLKTGVFQNAPNLNPDVNHGFDWSTDGSDGVQVLGETGYAHKQQGALIPDQYDIGVEIDRAHYSAAYYDPSNPVQYGRGVVYAQAQKLVYQPIANSSEGVYAFAIGVIGLDGSRQPSNFSIEAGGLYQGIIPSRPLDDAALMVNVLHYNNRYLDSLYDQRLAEGGTQRPNSNLVMMELNYTAQLTPWLNVTPNLQYIINPDGLGGLAYPKSNLKNAFVVGMQFNLDVANLFGVGL
jgi:porin